jgi:hypothetical protein
MKYFLLENPYLLIPVCAVAAYVVLVIHLRRRTSRTRKALLVGLALCLGLPVLQWLVVTPRERIRLVCADMVRAVENNDPAGIEGHIAQSFRVRAIDREQFVAALRSTLKAYDVEGTGLKLDECKVADGRAEVRLRVTGRIVADESYDLGPGMPWTLQFVEENGAWKLQAAEPRSTPIFPFNRLEDVLKGGP